MSADAQELTRLRSVIEQANNALFDQVAGLDVEHHISCHPEDLPEHYRRLAAAAQQAFYILQDELQKDFESTI